MMFHSFKPSVLQAVALTLLLTSPIRAAEFGVGNETGDPLPYAQLYASGVRIVRITANWPEIERVPGVYDFARLDAQVYGASAAGLIPYVNLMWAPAHASGGAPAYEAYTHGCTEWDYTSQVFITIGDGEQPANGGKTRWGIARPDRYVVCRGCNINVHASAGVLTNDGGTAIQAVTKDKPRHGTLTLNLDGSFFYQHDGSDATEDSFRYYTWGLAAYDAKSIHFEYETRDYCAHPPAIDGAKLRAIARAMAIRYRGTVDHFGAWNEPEYGIYYPPRDWSKPDDGTPDLVRYRDEVLIPFIDGIRSGNPSAQIVGPETGSPDALRWLLKAEQVAGAHWFDVISWHAYSWGKAYPGVALQRINEWLMPSLTDARPVWVSETASDRPANSDDAKAEMLAMATALRFDARMDYVIFLSSAPWFTDGQPSRFYFDFQTLTQPATRRRAVRGWR